MVLAHRTVVVPVLVVPFVRFVTLLGVMYLGASVDAVLFVWLVRFMSNAPSFKSKLEAVSFVRLVRFSSNPLSLNNRLEAVSFVWLVRFTSNAPKFMNSSKAVRFVWLVRFTSKAPVLLDTFSEALAVVAIVVVVAIEMALVIFEAFVLADRNPVWFDIFSELVCAVLPITGLSTIVAFVMLTTKVEMLAAVLSGLVLSDALMRSAGTLPFVVFPFNCNVRLSALEKAFD
jgi:hypothetical protein